MNQLRPCTGPDDPGPCVIQDGATLRVSMATMDGVQRGIASRDPDYEQGLADGRADNGQAAYEQRLRDAWRGQPAPAYRPAIPLSDSAQRQLSASRANHDKVAAWADHFSAKHDADLAAPDPGGYRAYADRVSNQWRATA